MVRKQIEDGVMDDGPQDAEDAAENEHDDMKKPKIKAGVKGDVISESMWPRKTSNDSP